MNIYCIYFPNGKRYVGLESQTGKRINVHKNMTSLYSKNPQKVHLAIKKYGWDNCKWRYLVTNCQKDYASKLERFFIKYFQTNKGLISLPAGPNGENRYFHPEQLI